MSLVAARAHGEVAARVLKATSRTIGYGYAVSTRQSLRECPSHRIACGRLFRRINGFSGAKPTYGFLLRPLTKASAQFGGWTYAPSTWVSRSAAVL